MPSSVFATLRLYGKDLDPDAVTAWLKVEPTDAGHPSETDGCRVEGWWFLSSEGRITSEGADAHVRWAIDALPVGTMPSEAPGVERASIDVYWYGTSRRDLRLPPSLLGRLAGLGLELWIDPTWTGVSCST